MPLSTGPGLLCTKAATGKVTVPTAASLNVFTGALTLEAWVCLRSYGTDDRCAVLVKTGLYYLTVDGSGQLSVYWFSANPPGYLSSTAIVPLNQWTHLAAAWDGANVRLYVNGVLDSTQASAYVGGGNQNNSLRIGADLNASTSWRMVDGLVRDGRVWSVARTGDEIAANMHATLTGGEAGLAGYWPLTEGRGAIAHDLTANANHGTIAGARWAQGRTRRGEGLSWTGGTTQYVELGVPIVFGGGVSIEAWVVPTKAAPGGDFLDIFNNNQCFLRRGGHLEGDAFEFFVVGSTGEAEPRASAAAWARTGKVAHVVGTWDGETVAVYVDGTLMGTSTHPGPLNTSGLIGPYIGGSEANHLPPTNQWAGDILLVRAYDRPLTAPEVLQNMLGNETRSGLVGEWLMSEGTGATTKDTSGGGNDGAIVGATWAAGPARTGATGYGVNLVQNGDFSDGGANWYVANTHFAVSGPATLTIIGDDAPPGYTQCGEYAFGGYSAGGWAVFENKMFQYMQQPYFKVGRTYQLSLWVKQASGGGDWFAQVCDGANSNAVTTSQTFTPTEEWQEVTMAFVAKRAGSNSGGGTGTEVYLKAPGTATTVRFGGVSIIEVPPTPAR